MLSTALVATGTREKYEISFSTEIIKNVNRKISLVCVKPGRCDDNG